jgi:hypothetical protein
MTPTNTPLTDAVSKAIGRHLAEYASRRSEGQHGTLADAAFDIGVELDAVRTLETRLHAAEKLLREAAPFVSGFRTATSRAGVASLSDAMQMKDIENRIAAHLANAVDPASATTTKETRP